MKVAFKTFGCKANSLDTDALVAEALRRGFSVVDETQHADAYVINSCTVTHAADRDARNSAARFKRLNPLARVGVVGCYGQVGKDELLATPQVDVVMGTAQKDQIFDWLMDQAAQRDQVQSTVGYLPARFPGSRHARASVKIQDGCNFKCSFCIIPQARGRSRSLDLQTVINQVAEAYSQGFTEVVLTGIHLAHYGWDCGTDLMELLNRLLEAPDGPRIRLSTLDPFEIPDELIALLGQSSRLCPHLHIALQSGSDSVLRKMRRIYKAAEFEEVTQKIGSAAPYTFIGVDMIVGFPGESSEDFAKTLCCLEHSFWTKLHVFPFSERAGTGAVDLPDKVPDSKRTERSNILRQMSDKRLQAFLLSQVGSLHEVLLEKPSTKHPGLWQGHTANYLATLSEPSPLSPPAARQTVRSIVVSVEGERVHTRPFLA